MRRLLTVAVLIGLLVGGPVTAKADLFDDAVQALGASNLEAASLDNMGRALKGGLVAGYPQYTPAPTVFHDFNISTPCGSFTFGTGLIDNFQAMLDPSAVIQGIQTTATSLIGAAISQLPMVTLCYAAPTMCDIVKYLQDMVNQILQFKGMSCQQAEQFLTGLGGRISGARTARCISAQQRAGLTLTKAEAACLGGSTPGIVDHATGLDITAGGSDGDSKLVEDSLTRVGASQEIKDFARELLGEVEVKAGSSSEEPVDVDIRAPDKRIHDVYDAEQRTLYTELENAITTVGTGGTLPDARREAVSLPGFAMPDGILDGMYAIRQADPATYQQYVRKLSGVFAILKMSWRINETRDKLEEGMLDNPGLGEAEQEVLEIRLARLERERDRFISEKEQMERHVLPVLQEIVRDYRERQIGAAEAIVGIGKDTATAGNQFGAQTPMGYDY
ncbi:MAG: conjugal transfer protein TraH [Candidatus Tectomicrobia bacterium]|nr:conjugal transfer protein TraH [Candidatus Tectomicrobia bacterium]